MKRCPEIIGCTYVQPIHHESRCIECGHKVDPEVYYRERVRRATQERASRARGESQERSQS